MISSLVRLATALPAAALATACLVAQPGPTTPLPPGGEFATEIHLTDLQEGVEVTRGVSIDPRSGDFVFLTNRGILHVSRQGEETFRHETEDNIFIPELGYSTNALTFGDIASLGDGTYALPMENMVRRFDPETNTASDYFCLEPGFVFQQMHNNAITVNFANNEILATPMITEEGSVVSNRLVRYRADTVALTSAVDLSSPIQPQGIALDRATDQILAVEGSQVHILTRSGEFVESKELESIQSASGVAIANDEDVLFVLDDATATLVAFRLSAITGG